MVFYMKTRTGMAVAGWVLAVAILCVFIAWTESKDAAIMASAQVYEDCVQTQYGMSPRAYEAQFGALPECNL